MKDENVMIHLMQKSSKKMEKMQFYVQFEYIYALANGYDYYYFYNVLLLLRYLTKAEKAKKKKTSERKGFVGLILGVLVVDIVFISLCLLCFVDCCFRLNILAPMFNSWWIFSFVYFVDWRCYLHT